MTPQPGGPNKNHPLKKKIRGFLSHTTLSPALPFFSGAINDYQRKTQRLPSQPMHAFRHQEISEPSCETERVVISPSSEPSKTRIAWPSKVSQ